jgi:Protein of unknown function (DUF2505)
MQKVFTFELDAPPEKVGQALCSEAYNVAVERDRSEVVACRYELVERTEERIHFDVHSTEHKRKKTGGVDRSATQESVNRNRYDVKARTLSWDYEGVGSQWVKCTGIYRLLPGRGEGTRLEHHVTIDVSIPLIGNRIAKYVVGEFEKAWRRFCLFLPRYV